MIIDEKIRQLFTQQIETSFPSLLSLIDRGDGCTLIIGAAVLEIFNRLGFIERVRATGDLDISIGLIADGVEYSRIRDALMSLNYREDLQRRFRLYSPVKNAHYRYVDLLAHPSGEISERTTRSIMGVGEFWSFEAIHFAVCESYTLTDRIQVPNPWGFLALKRASYIDDPSRTKDLVDILDLIWGVVNSAGHYQLSGLWGTMQEKFPDEALRVKDMLNGLASESVEWDLGSARQELEIRGYEFDGADKRTPVLARQLLEVM